jgi:hypothetical protein
MKRWALMFVVMAAMPTMWSQRARATEVAGGVVSGTLSCQDQHAAVDVSSPAFVYRAGAPIALTARMHGECRTLGSAVFADGVAHIVGDGIECGADPTRPLIAGYLLEGHHGVVQFQGPCVVDGTERAENFVIEGVVVDRSLTGVLTRPVEELPF